MMDSFLSDSPELLSDTIPGALAGWKAGLDDRLLALEEDTSVQLKTVRQ